MRLIWRFAIAGAVVFALVQFIHPGISTQPAKAEVDVPSGVKQVLEKSCYSCHSDEPRLAWFDQIEPGYWLVRHDILTARLHLNPWRRSARSTESQAVRSCEYDPAWRHAAPSIRRIASRRKGNR